MARAGRNKKDTASVAWSLLNEDQTPEVDRKAAELLEPVRNRQRANAMRHSLQTQEQQTALQGIATLTALIPGLGDVTGLAADAEMYANDPESRTWGNYALTGLGALPFVPSAAMVKAFHGSPHKFDKFSLDNIGTGEGAQAYGHGLYFAENPSVAGSYKQSGDINDFSAKIEASKSKMSSPFADSVFDDAYNMDVNELRKKYLSPEYIPEELGERPDWLVSQYEDAIKQIEAADSGNLYNVNLDVNHEDLLDWDAPLSEQPEKVRDAYNGLPDTIKGRAVRRGNEPTGMTIYDRIAEHYGGGSKSGRSQVAASQALKDAGIPGIRYLDGGSRGAGDGTRNLVIFDDSLIEIADDSKGLLGGFDDVPAASGIGSADEMIKELPGRNEMDVWIEKGDDAIESGWSDGSPVLVLDKLYIDPQNRGKGIGKQILKTKIDELSKQHPGMELKLLAEPLDDSIDTGSLVEYYESLGFSVGDYKDGMSGIPMEITLPKK